jgi:hypothetical protein
MRNNVSPLTGIASDAPDAIRVCLLRPDRWRAECRSAECSTRLECRDVRQPLGENLLGTILPPTAIAASRQFHFDKLIMPMKVGQPAAITAMNMVGTMSRIRGMATKAAAA